VKIYGAGGLAYIKVIDPNQGKEGLQSPIVKFLSEEIIETLLEKVEAKADDIIFFGAGSEKTVNDALGALRVKLGEDFQLVEESWRPLWIVDFPLVEWDSEEHRWHSLHHPFTAPSHVSSPEKLLQNPEKHLARAYDMVINGVELGGGSIRIHNKEMQMAAFHLLGILEEEANEKFSHLLKGLSFGCPPHGGIAFGIDRLVAMMLKLSNIREVIPFPKTQTGHCLLTKAPAEVAPNYLLEELKIMVFDKIMEESELGEISPSDLQFFELLLIRDIRKLESLETQDINKLEQLIVRRLIDLKALKKNK
jgi:aspartyl-tRNA synthetase